MSMFDKNRQAQTTGPRPVADTHAESTVPVSELRAVFRRMALDGGYLKNVNGGWHFSKPNPFYGLNADATYTSEDQAIDTILGLYFPEIRRVAA